MLRRALWVLAAISLFSLSLVSAQYAEISWEFNSSAAGALSVALGALAAVYFAASIVATGIATDSVKVKVGHVAAAASALAFSSVLPLGLLFNFARDPAACGMLAFFMGLFPVMVYLLASRESDSKIKIGD